jgi:short-subunit dehydrogenase
MDYRDLIAVVTGASTGIGRETALELTRRGATVIGIARGAENLTRLRESARGLSGTMETARADVSDAEAIMATLRDLAQAHGRIDVLVNNAGTGAYKPAARMTVVEFESIMRTNYLGAVACSLAVLPGMLGRRSGHIVNVSSPSAFSPPPGQTAYAASKAALDAFSESLLLEVRDHGVRVSIVYPGHVITPLTLEQFKGQPMPPASVCMDAARVAAAVLEALEGGRFRIYLPWFVGLTPLVKSLAPEFVRRQTLRAQPLTGEESR